MCRHGSNWASLPNMHRTLGMYSVHKDTLGIRTVADRFSPGTQDLVRTSGQRWLVVCECSRDRGSSIVDVNIFKIRQQEGWRGRYLMQGLFTCDARPRIRVPVFNASWFAFYPVSCRYMRGEAADEGSRTGSLPPTWNSLTEVSILGFSLAQPSCWHLGNKAAHWRSQSISVTLSCSFSV